MALIKCLQCGAEISDKADVCPKCGYEIKQSVSTKEKKPKKKLLWIIILCLIVIAVVVIVGKNFSENLETVKQESDDSFIKITEFFGQNEDGELPDDLRDLTESIELFGLHGTLHLESVGADTINTVYFNIDSKLSFNEYNKLFECLKEKYGSDYNTFEHDDFTGYGWKNVENFTSVALNKKSSDEGEQTYICFQNINETKEEPVDEYGTEQMVGYNSLVALEEGSPVIVSGVVVELSNGIYAMSIFADDPKDVDINNIEEKTIYIFDLGAETSYDKCYISVEGHTKLSEDLPIVVAENISDESEIYIQSGGMLPE